MSEKVRTGIYISEDLLRECDEYLSKNGGSRSELIESALRLYLATRKIKDKSEVLVPELAECISAASDEGITTAGGDLRSKQKSPQGRPPRGCKQRPQNERKDQPR